MRVVRLDPALVSEPSAPLPDDTVFAVGGSTFPNAKDFTSALENYPCVISVSRGDPVSSPLEQKSEPDFSRWSNKASLIFLDGELEVQQPGTLRGASSELTSRAYGAGCSSSGS